MSSAADDEAIRVARIALARARARCEQRREAVRTAATTWVVAWWHDQTRMLVRRRPEVALHHLGPAGLEALSRSLDALCDAAPDLVATELGTTGVDTVTGGLVWPHVGDETALLQLVHGGGLDRRQHWTPTLSGRLAGPLDHALRAVAGRLGPLVTNAGLDAWHVPGTPEDVGGGWVRDATGVRWAYGIDYSAELLDRVQHYGNALRGLEMGVRDLRDAQQESLVDEASALWDEIRSVTVEQLAG